MCKKLSIGLSHSKRFSFSNKNKIRPICISRICHPRGPNRIWKRYSCRTVRLFPREYSEHRRASAEEWASRVWKARRHASKLSRSSTEFAFLVSSLTFFGHLPMRSWVSWFAGVTSEPLLVKFADSGKKNKKQQNFDENFRMTEVRSLCHGVTCLFQRLVSVSVLYAAVRS